MEQNRTSAVCARIILSGWSHWEGKLNKKKESGDKQNAAINSYRLGRDADDPLFLSHFARVLKKCC